ncbi:uncharacterized protein LOC143329214 [Chaetodon auriga]|uniref:uncharacterized protein LOC143329214 n=1 Tax=Chaetodon auriga TaxID=39042 RepID=UPI0040329AA3
MHNSSAVGEGLQRLWSSDEVHHQEEDPVLRPCGHTGRYNAHLSHCPVCRSETTHRETVSRSNRANEDGSQENFFRWRRNVPQVVFVLTGVILLIRRDLSNYFDEYNAIPTDRTNGQGEHLSNVPDAMACEHLPTQDGYDDKLQPGQDPDEDDEHTDELP